MSTVIDDPDHLFSPEPYDVPFPEADGKKVDQIIIRLAGAIKLNRNDPAHTEFIEGLKLGRYVSLNVMAGVVGKFQTVKEELDGSETVSHIASLRVHTAELDGNSE